MDIEKESWNAEEDTRIKTHIIPFHCQAKNNAFHMELSQPINVLSNAITYIDFNLQGTPSTPLFNTITTPQVFQYDEGEGPITVNIPPGYYTVEDLFNLCNFSLIPKSVIEEIPESEEIHPSAEGHYTPIYGNYVYPEFQTSKDAQTNRCACRINGTIYTATIPDRTYNDVSYFWETFKSFGKLLYPNASGTRVLHTLAYDDEYIYMKLEDVPTCTCLGETANVIYDAKNKWYWSGSAIYGGIWFLTDYINVPKNDNIQKASYTIKRIYTSRELLYYNVEVLEGYNTFTFYIESDVGEQLKYEFTLPPGWYTEPQFYEYLIQQFNTDNEGYAEMSNRSPYPDIYYILIIYLNGRWAAWHATADDLDHSLFIYRGVLHNIIPNEYYKDRAIYRVKRGKDIGTVPYEMQLPSNLENHAYTHSASIDFTQAQELQEILGFTQSQYQNTDLAIWSERTIDITRNQGMFICDTNLTDQGQNSLYSFNIHSPTGNNQFHDHVNIIVNKSLEEVQDLWFRFRDLSGQYTQINDGVVLSGFLELADRVIQASTPQTIKKLCLNCITYDDHFSTMMDSLHLHNKIIKDVIIQSDPDEANNRYTNTHDFGTCTINGEYYPSFVFPLNEKYLCYGNINSHLTIDQQIDVRFNTPFRGNIVLNICEPVPIERRFKDYDEVYCDFTHSHALKFELPKSKRYNFQYITNIQVISYSGHSDPTQVYPLSLSCYTSPYENIIHVIDSSNLPYFYTYGCKYENIQEKIIDSIYFCNRKTLKLLPNLNDFLLTCYYPCIAIITVSYI